MSVQRVKFGDVVRKVNDKVDPVAAGLKRYVAGEHMETDEPRIRQFGNVGDGYLGPAFQMRFKPGHILYGSRRTYLRKAALVDFEGVCANTTFVLEPSIPDLNNEYLLSVMSTDRFHEFSIAQSKGSTNPYINFSDLADFEFDLPSLDEQARLIAHIALVDAHLQSLSEMLGALNTLSKAVLRDRIESLVTYGAAVELQSLCSIYQPRTIATSEMDDSGAFPVFGAAGEIGRYHAFNHVESEVVVTCRGASCGEVHMTPENAWITGNAMVVTPSDGRVSRAFIFAALKAARRRLLMTVSGSAQPQITRKSLSPLLVPCPDSEYQREVVEVLKQIEGSIRNTRSMVISIRQLRASMLNRELP
jgi:restriction endonuclease S subunit